MAEWTTTQNLGPCDCCQPGCRCNLLPDTLYGTIAGIGSFTLTLQTIGSFFGWSGKIFLPCAGREVEVRVKKQNAEKCYTWWVCYDINGNEVGEAVTPMLFDFTSCSPIVIRLRGFAARTQCQVGTCPFGGYEITVTT
jgi:hypothetical protein